MTEFPSFVLLFLKSIQRSEFILLPVWFIYCSFQNLELDGQQVCLNLQADGHIGSFESSSGNFWDLVVESLVVCLVSVCLLYFILKICWQENRMKCIAWNPKVRRKQSFWLQDQRRKLVYILKAHVGKICSAVIGFISLYFV